MIDSLDIALDSSEATFVVLMNPLGGFINSTSTKQNSLAIPHVYFSKHDI